MIPAALYTYNSSKLFLFWEMAGLIFVLLDSVAFFFVVKCNLNVHIWDGYHVLKMRRLQDVITTAISFLSFIYYLQYTIRERDYIPLNLCISFEKS